MTIQNSGHDEAADLRQQAEKTTHDNAARLSEATRRTLLHEPRTEQSMQLSRDFLEGLINRIADPVVVKDNQHRFVLVNDAECTLVGQTRAMLLGKTDHDFFPREQVDVFWKMDDRVLETGEASLNEESVKHGLTGEPLTVMTHKTRYVDPCGNRFVVAVIRDVTGRKQAAEALQESERRAQRQRMVFAALAVNESIGFGDVHGTKRMLAESASRALEVERSSVWLLSADGRELECIELFEASSGKHSQGQVLRAGDYPRYFEAMRNQSRIPAVDARTDHRTSEFTQGYLVPLGITSMLDAMISVEGGLAGVVCLEHTGEKRTWHPDEESFASVVASLMAQAITNASRKRTEEALREKNRLIEDIIASAQEGVIVYDRNLRYQVWNPFMERLSGVPAAKVIGRLPLEVFPFLRETGVIERLERALAGETPVAVDFPYTVPETGRSGWSSDTSGPLRNAAGEIVGVIATVSDLTERKQAEEETRRARDWFRTIFNASRDGIIAEENEIIILCNSAFAHFYGYAEPGELVGNHVSIIQSPEDNERMLRFGQMRLHDEPAPNVYEFRGLRKDGSLVAAEASVSKVEIAGRNYIVSVIRDLAARKQAEAEKETLEAQNRQLQKAESLGRMAGAIAHHFNNKLAAVMMNLDMVLSIEPRNEGSIENLTEAMQAARKAAEVSSMMLTYLGQTPGKRKPLDLADACRQCVSLLRAALPKNVVLETDLPSPGPAISAEANQMQQVLTNLVTNAWEASGDGRSAIRLAVKMVSTADIPAAHRFPIDWRPRDHAYVCLEVADMGCGIASQDIEAIFDPFFTRKFTGRGMGLPVVLGIVRAHDGVVTVTSEPGRGSVFRIFFPVSAEAVPRPPDRVVPALKFMRGGAMLLVDDELVLRKVLASALKSLGFTVLAAKDGIEALELFRQHREEIRFVLCDLTMPRMDGWETLTALRQLAPGLPVILSSGYNEAQFAEGDHSELPQFYLSKPYMQEQLIDAINHVLANPKN